MRNLLRLSMVLALALICAAGCNSSKKAGKVDDLNTDSLESSRQHLLDRIEKKYSDADAHYQLGKLYMQDRLWTKAEYEFNIAIGLKPMFHKAMAAMVRTQISSGNEAQAKLAADMYLKQVNGFAEDSYLLGKAFQTEGIDAFVLPCYQQALMLAPNSALVNKQIGYYYLSTGEKIRAQEYLRRSFQLDPYQSDVAGELGKMGVVVQIPKKKEKKFNLGDLNPFKKKEL